MPDHCLACRGSGVIRETTWEGKAIAMPCDSCGGTGQPVAVLRRVPLVVSDCKSGAWLRCTTEGEGERIAKLKGWKDFEIKPEVRHV